MHRIQGVAKQVTPFASSTIFFEPDDEWQVECITCGTRCLCDIDSPGAKQSQNPAKSPSTAFWPCPTPWACDGSEVWATLSWSGYSMTTKTFDMNFGQTDSDSIEWRIYTMHTFWALNAHQWSLAKKISMGDRNVRASKSTPPLSFSHSAEVRFFFWGGGGGRGVSPWMLRGKILNVYRSLNELNRN